MEQDPSPTAPGPRPADASTIEAISDVVSVHVNQSHWWNNASFALPLLVAIVSIVIGLLFSSDEALGFGLFAVGVTVVLLPMVFVTWRRTATAVVLTREAAVALHQGRELLSMRWDEVAEIEAADYDSIRWRIRPRKRDHLNIETELHDMEGLVEHAFALSNLARSESERR
ncbi:MAG TPA: hypothetical protein QGI71_06490 [Dehalococcoidia bacterium]|nr:hypothetical protein [Dehalococcoidia bacterium]